jgi:hypothetical protein
MRLALRTWDKSTAVALPFRPFSSSWALVARIYCFLSSVSKLAFRFQLLYVMAGDFTSSLNPCTLVSRFYEKLAVARDICCYALGREDVQAVGRNPSHSLGSSPRLTV